MQYEERYAAHPDDAKGYDTDRLRREFLIEKLFEHRIRQEGSTA